MRRYRTIVLGALAWVVVVAAGATLVWAVISQAGSGVAGELPSTESLSGQAGPTGRPKETSHPSPSGSTAPTGPSATGSGTPRPSTSSAPAPPGPAPSSSSSSGHDQQNAIRRTWRGAAGVVIVECRGSQISLVGANVASGWSFEVDDSGSEEVVVEFESSTAHTHVKATCRNGVPHFEVEAEED